MTARRRARRIALTIAAAYLVGGALWILLSDRAVAWLAADLSSLAGFQLVKGTLFVVVTALALYLLIQLLASRQLRAAQRFESLLEVSMLMVCQFDGERVTVLKASQPALQALHGVDLDQLWGMLHPDDVPVAKAAWRDAQGHTDPMDYDARMRIGDEMRWVHIRGVRTQFDDRRQRQEWIGTVADIHERKIAEQALRESAESLARLANLDDLTGLPNRRQMRDRLEQALLQASTSGESVALIMMDLDHFKLVNDTLGHEAGDRLLCEAARRLALCVRERDQLARLGGDEFTILLSGVDDEQTVALVGERVIRSMEQPFSLEGREVYVSATLGTALYPRNATDADGLQRRADLALYAGKVAGRGVHRFFTPELEARSVKRMQLETGLRKAVERGEIELRMRPLFRLSDGMPVVVDVEAWWRHPQLGLLAPAAYRGVAEQSRQGDAIGEYVMGETLRQLAQWQALGLTQLRVPLHVSARELSDRRLARQLHERITAQGLSADSIIVSFTESELMGKVGDAVGVLDALSRMGFRIAIERFGTGSSNLADLKRFPLNAMRIDASYVRDIPGDADDAAIVRTMIGLAHNFGIAVMADGVDGPQQAQFLRENGCDIGSGQYWAEPMDAGAFTAWLINYIDSAGRSAAQ